MRFDLGITVLIPSVYAAGVLKYGTPESVSLLPQPLQDMKANVSGYTKPGIYGSFSHYVERPIEPGSATLFAHKGTIVSSFAVGKRNLYADVSGTLLPARQQEDATTNTIYDMASLTKLFTAIATLREFDIGRLALNRTVASYMPAFAANDKENVTILQLLTHTSGFDADPEPPLYSPEYTTYEERTEAILKSPLLNTPGTEYLYSDLNFLSLQQLLEHVTHKPLDKLIGEYTSALGMTSTFFNRGNKEGPRFPFYHRMATQEFQLAALNTTVPARPQPVRGTVHDENAWSLDGVAGHAGLFSTVGDTAKLCQMILNNGTYGAHKILKPETVDLIFTNFNSRFSGNEHGLGFELNQYYTCGPMRSLQVASHTGFTGTTVCIDRGSGSFWLHFANRVHPSRAWSSNNIVREAVGYWVAKSFGRDVAYPTI